LTRSPTLKFLQIEGIDIPFLPQNSALRTDPFGPLGKACTTNGCGDQSPARSGRDRRELGEIERAELMARWVEITAAKHEADAKEAAAEADVQSAQLAQIEKSKRADGRGHRKAGGIRQAARELGVPRDQVARSVKIAALSPRRRRQRHGSEPDKTRKI